MNAVCRVCFEFLCKIKLDYPTHWHWNKLCLIFVLKVRRMECGGRKGGHEDSRFQLQLHFIWLTVTRHARTKGSIAFCTEIQLSLFKDFFELLRICNSYTSCSDKIVILGSCAKSCATQVRVSFEELLQHSPAAHLPHVLKIERLSLIYY